MKKTIISLLLAIFMTACATTQLKQQDLHPLMTLETVKANCEVFEEWQIGVVGLTSHVIRYEKCLKVDPLIMIAIDTDVHTDDINRISIDLLAAHYVSFLNKNDETKTYSVEKLKEERDKKDGWLVYYYAVKQKEKEKKE